MSEYQYYEFQAIDRPLGEADRKALRAISSRAQITATSFSNHYEWGDLKGDPAKFMERWFDLHLYFANWGSRRLMIRVPARLVDRYRLDQFVGENDGSEVTKAGDNLVLDIRRDELEYDFLDFENEDSTVLAALAPLRGDLLAGDLRFLYLVWLMAVEEDAYQPDVPEPLPGIGPMTGPLKAFADFFCIDPDLVDAAAERTGAAPADALSPEAIRVLVSELPGDEKVAWLLRLAGGGAHLATEFSSFLAARASVASATVPSPAPRTVGDLRARAEAIRAARMRKEAERLAEEARLKVEAEQRAERAEIDALAARGLHAWREVEDEIGKRNPAGYDRAARLLRGLGRLAAARGTQSDFADRLHDLRQRHANKLRFLERIERL
jgi:hypothetical protein